MTSWTKWCGAALLVPAVALGCRSAQKQEAGCATCGDRVHAPVASVVQMPPPMIGAAGPPAALSGRAYATMPAPVAAPVPRPLPVAEHVVSSESLKVTVSDPVPVAAAAVGGYHHSPDYTALVGELHYNPRHDTWRLRYAGVDTEDAHGGSVTLQNVGRLMQGFRTGQTVRVQGELADRDTRELSPAYRVRDIYPVGN